MNVFDLTIIYFACGAPFAVYFYLQNRRRLFSRQLIFQTVLNFIFWIPFSLRFSYKFLISIKKSSASVGIDNLNIENLNAARKQLEQLAAKASGEFNFYEFREILNRYIGLKTAVLNENKTVGEKEREIFQFSNFENSEIGSICLHRRNLQRLLFHQKLAAADFVKAVCHLQNELHNSSETEKFSIELTGILKDFQTQKNLKNFFAENLQIINVSNVKNAEKIIWNSPPSKPRKPEQILINTTSMNRTNLRLKD